MKWAEIVEAKPSGSTGGVAPLSPKQARKRAERKARADQHVADVRSANAARLQTAQHKAAEI